MSTQTTLIGAALLAAIMIGGVAVSRHLEQQEATKQAAAKERERQEAVEHARLAQEIRLSEIDAQARAEMRLDELRRARVQKAKESADQQMEMQMAVTQGIQAAKDEARTKPSP